MRVVQTHGYVLARFRARGLAAPATYTQILMITVDEIGSSWKCPVDSSTEEHLFDRLNLDEPRASRYLSVLDRQAGLDKDSAKPRTN